MNFNELTNSQKHDPYEMVKFSLQNNFDDFIERVLFENKKYSIKEASAMVHLYSHIGKDEKDICSFLKSIQIKELDSFQSLIDLSMGKMEHFNNSDAKTYYLEEQKTKTKTFENIELQKNKNNPVETIIKAEQEIIHLAKLNSNIQNSDIFFDNIDKMKAVILCSSVFLQGKDIYNKEELNLNKLNSFSYLVFESEIHQQAKVSKENKEELKPKMKKEIKLKHRQRLKPNNR